MVFADARRRYGVAEGFAGMFVSRSGEGKRPVHDVDLPGIHIVLHQLGQHRLVHHLAVRAREIAENLDLDGSRGITQGLVLVHCRNRRQTGQQNQSDAAA